MGAALIDVAAIYSKGLLSNRVGRLVVTEDEALFVETSAPIVGGALEGVLQKLGKKTLRMPFATISRIGRSKRGRGEVVEIDSDGTTQKFMAGWAAAATPLAAAIEAAGYRVETTIDGWHVGPASATAT